MRATAIELPRWPEREPRGRHVKMGTLSIQTDSAFTVARCVLRWRWQVPRAMLSNAAARRNAGEEAGIADRQMLPNTYAETVGAQLPRRKLETGASTNGMRVSIESGFPFRQIVCLGSGCSGHRWLDGFTAHYQDEVWNYIEPPNGEGCFCTKLKLLEEQVPAGSEARLPGMQRLTSEQLHQCLRGSKGS